jgi:hypothetical protein
MYKSVVTAAAIFADNPVESQHRPLPPLLNLGCFVQLLFQPTTVHVRNNGR